MSSQNREDGFYWVKWRGDWTVAEFYNLDYLNCYGHFMMCGDDYGRDAGEFDEINETPLTPP